MQLVELDNELIDTREALARSQGLERHIAFLDAALAAERELERTYSALVPPTLTPPENAVRRVPFSVLYTTVMARRTGRLDLQRQETLAAALKLENVRARIQVLEREQVDLARKRAGLAGLAQRFAVQLAGRQKLANDAGEAGRLLAEASDRLAATKVRERELLDILHAGERARSALDQAVNTLRAAQRWGVWDLFGGGAAVHSRLDQAYCAVQDTQPFLLIFEREMACGEQDPVSQGNAAHTENTNSLAHFADIVSDALLVDLLAQCELSEALDSAAALAQRVNNLVTGISQRLELSVRAVQAGQAGRREMVDQVR